MRQAVIMAGGAGIRLWPLSRKKRPKQVLRLFNNKSLIRQSFERITTVVPPENIHVITNMMHVDVIADELPELPRENLIGEPEGRDTASAVGLSASILAHKDPEAVIGMFTADHIITPVERFTSAVNSAYETAEKNSDALVTIGIKPSRPDTNYGYIKAGHCHEKGICEVDAFTEKPNVTSAMKYISAGDYYWNSGMFTWQAKTILGQLQKHLPTTYDVVHKIASGWDSPKRDELLKELYPTLLKISIDFAVMERADRAMVVEMDCHWVDVGSWPAIESLLDASEEGEGNVSVQSRVVHLGSRGNIVVSEDEHLVATIGVDDLVIVHSSDATLICKKRDASSIRELVDNIHEKYGQQYQ